MDDFCLFKRFLENKAGVFGCVLSKLSIGLLGHCVQEQWKALRGLINGFHMLAVARTHFGENVASAYLFELPHTRCLKHRDLLGVISRGIYKYKSTVRISQGKYIYKY